MICAAAKVKPIFSKDFSSKLLHALNAPVTLSPGYNCRSDVVPSLGLMWAFPVINLHASTYTPTLPGICCFPLINYTCVFCCLSVLCQLPALVRFDLVRHSRLLAPQISS